MNKKTIVTLGSVLFFALCVGACVGLVMYKIVNIPSIKQGLQTTGSEMNAMLDLREKLLEAYQCPDVGVQIMNGHILNISVINSEFNKLSQAQQESKAHQIALFTKNNYAGDADIDRIVIIFVQNNRIGPFSTNWSSSVSFDIAELE